MCGKYVGVFETKKPTAITKRHLIQLELKLDNPKEALSKNEHATLSTGSAVSQMCPKTNRTLSGRHVPMHVTELATYTVRIFITFVSP